LALPARFPENRLFSARINVFEQTNWTHLPMTPPVHGNSALFLDIDGTLLDLARTPDSVVVPHELLATLTRLHQQLGGALAFVSGRPLSAIDKLFSPLRTAAIGCHGAEVRGADGKVKALAPPIASSVRSLFAGLAQAHPGVLLEDKVYALALHYRLAPEAKPGLIAALDENSDLLKAACITLAKGKAVIDARPSGIDKGVGLSALVAQKPFAGRPILFGGDDTTDLDVFRILPRLGGQGFSVGRHFPGVEHVFASPRAVRQWLARLAEQGMAA
jgi:trehalose 6-phosphate phosphatase